MEMHDAVSGTERRTRLWIALGLLIAAVVAAIILIIVLSSGSSNSTTTIARPTPPAKTVRAATLPELRAESAALGRPIYWAGPRLPETYELTTTTDGRVYVRYLPQGVSVGSPRPDFLTVGTYAVTNPVASLRTAARNRGGVLKALPGGAVAYYNRARPTSVYLAYPNSTEQIEVFDPSPATALGLVVHGKVTPVG
jgi:hypothetical protein